MSGRRRSTARLAAVGEACTRRVWPWTLAAGHKRRAGDLHIAIRRIHDHGLADDRVR
jgi:hypothetical protein